MGGTPERQMRDMNLEREAASETAGCGLLDTSILTS
jgi:hypothetical protein